MKLYFIIAILLFSMGIILSKRIKWGCQPTYNWRTGLTTLRSSCVNNYSSIPKHWKITGGGGGTSNTKRGAIGGRRSRTWEEKKRLEEYNRSQMEKKSKKMAERKVLKRISCWAACKETDPSGKPKKTDAYEVSTFIKNNAHTRELKCYMKKNKNIEWAPPFCYKNISKYNKQCWHAEERDWYTDRSINTSCIEDYRKLKINKVVLKYVK